MDGSGSNEALAARIKAGEKSLLPILWGQCRRTIMILAAKYRGIAFFLLSAKSRTSCLTIERHEVKTFTAHSVRLWYRRQRQQKV